MDPKLDYLPRLPRDKSVAIGCIGSGFIMADCHLVAYRKAGFNPVAIASRTPAHARRIAERHGLTAEDEMVDRIFRRAKSSPTVLTEAEILAEVSASHKFEGQSTKVS